MLHLCKGVELGAWGLSYLVLPVILSAVLGA